MKSRAQCHKLSTTAGPHPSALPALALRWRRAALRCLLLGLGGLAWTAAAQTGQPDAVFPQFNSATRLHQACDQGLAQARRGLARLRSLPADGQWLAAHDAFMAEAEDAYSPLAFLSAVHPQPAVRAASEACERRWVAFHSALMQDPHIYQALRQLPTGDASDQALVKRLRESYEDAGVGLPAAQRQRVRQLQDRITQLGQTFERNIRDAKTALPFTEAELAGVPVAVWQDAKRDARGRRLLDLSYPVYWPVVQSAEQARTRERMWRAKTNEGGARNLALLAQITQLRAEYARLLGAPSWAHLVLRRQMAATPQRAQGFLDEVHAAVQGREQREVEELRQAKADHLGQPLERTRLERWDVFFYTERLRQARYSVDQEAFRRHFPPQESLAWAMRLVERLMGVRYVRLPDAQAWHPEVQTYQVVDAASQAVLGTMWVDLYPREGKYNHAAVWPLRGSSKLTQRRSQTALVVNLDRQGLSLDELETVLHELGHAVHGNLSATRYSQLAGTSVPGDFVEAPSQMLEDWVYDARALGLMAEVCPSCTPVPDALLAQAQVARHYGKGMATARQHLYASYDLTLYGPQPQDPLALWQRVEGATPLGHVAGTRFPAGFGHIATNYSAGYYGYLWSLVVAADLRTAFAHDRLDAAVGQRYRQAILAHGSEQEPADMVRAFLGRDFNAQAFFADLQR